MTDKPIEINEHNINEYTNEMEKQLKENPNGMMDLSKVFEAITTGKPVKDNVIPLPSSENELHKDQLLLQIRTSINDLQRFITVHSVGLFTAWDLTDLEESKDRLMLTWETLRKHGK